MNPLNILLQAPVPPADNSGMSSIILFMIVSLFVIMFIFISPQKKKQEQLKKEKEAMEELMEWEKDNTTYKNNTIPTSCPHCKNPNTKKLRECEWCGNEIC